MKQEGTVRRAVSRPPRPAPLGLLLAVLVSACGAPPPSAPPKPPNVFVVLVDTLRADRLGAYGCSRRLTPFLDTFAARAAVFSHAYAQSSWTAPSVASLFTSRFQSQHGVVAFASRLDVAEVTIAEVLHEQGYATGAFLANAALVDKMGYAQGFDVYRTYWRMVGEDGKPTKVRGKMISAEAIRWLDKVQKEEPQRPVFVYLHYLEPHLPYSPPGPMLERVGEGRTHPDVERASAAMFFATVKTPDAAALRNIQDVYDAEVLSLDNTLRHTFAGLRARHLLDNGVVVFTADHGEEFQDHGKMGHGVSLYNELIHVPLMIVAPRQTARRDVRDVVSLIDVAPTLADLAGVEPPKSFEGRSLRPLIAPPARPWWQRLLPWPSRPPPTRPALSELVQTDGQPRSTPHERAIVLDHRKLIVTVDGAREQYDLSRDPAEEIRGAAEQPLLDAALRDFETRFGEAKRAPLPTVPPELGERLKALGYLQ